MTTEQTERTVTLDGTTYVVLRLPPRQNEGNHEGRPEYPVSIEDANGEELAYAAVLGGGLLLCAAAALYREVTP